MDRTKIDSNADRRSGAERRNFLYVIHIPERRSGRDRRDRLNREHESIFNRYDLEQSKTYH